MLDMKSLSLSPMTREVLATLGISIRAGRLRRGWTATQLAERAGVSRQTLVKIEQGDPSVSIGSVFEAALLAGVPLFDDNEITRRLHSTLKQTELALLPSAARRARRTVNDDF
jgi:transcriptional regulator with XRE-family HTH domain